MTGFLPVTPGRGWIRAITKDPADADWVLAKLVPQPLSTFLQPVRLGNPAAAALPRVFVLCTADANGGSASTHVRPPRVRADPNWRVVELADNHLAPINSPQATAEALLALIETGSSRALPSAELLPVRGGCTR